MEIIIKIPEKLYKQITVEKKYFLEDGENLCTAVANGIPLPKGHGRLIDADAFGKKLHRYTEAPYQYALKVFNESQVIVNADKESEVEE